MTNLRLSKNISDLFEFRLRETFPQLSPKLLDRNFDLGNCQEAILDDILFRLPQDGIEVLNIRHEVPLTHEPIGMLDSLLETDDLWILIGLERLSHFENLAQLVSLLVIDLFSDFVFFFFRETTVTMIENSFPILTNSHFKNLTIL